MFIFLLSYLSIYGGAHLYLLLKIRSFFHPGWGGTIAVSLFLVLMVLSPMLTRVCERLGQKEGAWFLAHAGYIWMGFFFAFFSASVFLELYRLSFSISTRFFPGTPLFLGLSGKICFLLSLCWGGVVALYGYYDAGHIRVERLSLESTKLPIGSSTLTIAQISDVHLGIMLSPGRLKGIVGELRALAPDIIVSTGDLIDSDIDGLESMLPLWRSLQPPLGKYAVTGNHEVYAGLEKSLEFTAAAGFRMLRNEHLSVGPHLTIAGADDPALFRSGKPRNALADRALAGISPRTFTLFLKHRPTLRAEESGAFDLQLSGHVHKGQIWPFNLLTWCFYPVKAGYTPLEKGGGLYVSRGTGTWGPPIRFLAPPEITFITISPAQLSLSTNQAGMVDE